MHILKYASSGLMFLSALGLVGVTNVSAATTPSLGVAGTFGILASTFTRNIGVTSIVGDLGYTTLSGGGTNTVSGSTHVADGTYNQAGIDQGTALSALSSQPCTFTFASGAIDLATDTTHGPIGVYTPGVYCTAASSAASIGTAGIALSGAGTYIFRINGALTSVANSAVALINGASACDVFWTPTAATTLGANSTFAGTLIDASGITVGSTVSMAGRALAFGGTVTTDTDTISAPVCAVAPTPTPTPVITPTPTPIPTLTPTPIPTLTPIPTPTPTPTPTFTPIPTPTPTPVATATPTPFPPFPGAGIGPDKNSGIPWNAIIPSVILVALFSLYLARKKQIT